MHNEKPSRIEILTTKVHGILRLHNKLTGAEQKKDASVWGYSNPVATNFTSAEEAISFFRQFEELEELDLHHSRFTCFVNATMFEINLKISK
jgi:hypothetical protein